MKPIATTLHINNSPNLSMNESSTAPFHSLNFDILHKVHQDHRLHSLKKLKLCQEICYLHKKYEPNNTMIRPSIDTVLGLILNFAKTRTKGFANFSDAFLKYFSSI